MSNYFEYLERIYNAGYNAFINNESEVCKDTNFYARKEYLRGYNDAYFAVKNKPDNVSFMQAITDAKEKKPYSFSTPPANVQKKNSEKEKRQRFLQKKKTNH